MNKKIWRSGKFLAAGMVLICLMSVLLIPAVCALGTGEVSLTVKQVINSGSASAPPSGTFRYRLTPKTASAPMPAGSGPEGYTFHIAGTDEAQIGPIRFSAAGIYRYDLRCVAGMDAGCSVDPQVYTIEIHVVETLETISIVYLSDGVKASEISFEHTYGTTLPSDPETTGTRPSNPEVTVPPPSRPGPGKPGGDGPNTGLNSNLALWVTLMVASNMLLIFIFILWKSRKSRDRSVPEIRN